MNNSLPASVGDVRDDALCETCGHPLTAHDATGPALVRSHEARGRHPQVHVLGRAVRGPRSHLLLIHSIQLPTRSHLTQTETRLASEAARSTERLPVPETERMTLRRTNWPDVDDVAAMNAARGGRPVRDMSATVAHVLSEEMPRLMAHNRRDDQLGSWVARDRSTGSFLGWFTVRPIDSPVRTVELSYRLVDRTRGEGYDVEGALRMIAMARDAQVATVVAIGTARRHRVRRGDGAGGPASHPADRRDLRRRARGRSASVDDGRLLAGPGRGIGLTDRDEPRGSRRSARAEAGWERWRLRRRRSGSCTSTWTSSSPRSRSAGARSSAGCR